MSALARDILDQYAAAFPRISRMEAVRVCLREGATTSSEVAASTGLSIKNACARLRYLESAHYCRRIGKIGRAILFERNP